MSWLDRAKAFFDAGTGGGGDAPRVTKRTGKGEYIVDVRGQTCPGYLLSINREVDAIEAGARVTLLISYPPCGDDVRVWCAEKGHVFLGLEQRDGNYLVSIRKGLSRSGE